MGDGAGTEAIGVGIGWPPLLGPPDVEAKPEAAQPEQPGMTLATHEEAHSCWAKTAEARASEARRVRTMVAERMWGARANANLSVI